MKRFSTDTPRLRSKYWLPFLYERTALALKYGKAPFGERKNIDGEMLALAQVDLRRNSSGRSGGRKGTYFDLLEALQKAASHSVLADHAHFPEIQRRNGLLLS